MLRLSFICARKFCLGSVQISNRTTIQIWINLGTLVDLIDEYLLLYQYLIDDGIINDEFGPVAAEMRGLSEEWQLETRVVSRKNGISRIQIASEVFQQH